MTKRDEALRSTAYHEAGHAVLHHHFGHLVKRATTIPGDGFVGHVETFRGRWSRFVECGVDLTPAAEVGMRENIICLLAGKLAVRHLGDRRWRRGASSDDHSVVDLASWLSDGNMRIANALIRCLHITTEEMIASQRLWRRIEAVATALVQRRTLTGKETAEVIMEADASVLPPDLREWSRKRRERKSTRQRAKTASV